jgi:hypothetical protein
MNSENKHQISNVDELLVKLCDLYIKIEEGSVSVKTATEMNNTAGKIINACKVQIEFMELRLRVGSDAAQLKFLTGGKALKDVTPKVIDQPKRK